MKIRFSKSDYIDTKELKELVEKSKEQEQEQEPEEGGEESGE